MDQKALQEKPQNQQQDPHQNQQQYQKKDLSQMSADELMKEFMDAWEKSSDQPAKKPKCL